MLAVVILGLLGFADFSAPPTFSSDIAPIIHQHCSGCHRADHIGPFPLIRYEDVSKRANQISDLVSRREMPPWKPVPGHGEFQDSRTLTVSQIQKIKDWVLAGVPLGEPGKASTVGPILKGFQLGQPDFIWELPEPFSVPPEGDDIYMHYVIPLKLKEERHLRGIEVIPGNRRVAHHALGFLDATGTARKLVLLQDGKGYSRFGGAGFLPKGITTGYGPGTIPRFFEKETGLVIKPGTDLVLQMHYHPSGKLETDRPKVGLYITDKKNLRNLVGFPMGSENLDIPAGEKDYRVTDRFQLPSDFEVRGIWAHMHLLGKQVKVHAELPDKKIIPLLKIIDWDYHWQENYLYVQPVSLPKGTWIHAEFAFDNSMANPHNPNSPPKRVVFGDSSAGEMAMVWLSGCLIKPEDEVVFKQSVLEHSFKIKIKPNK